MKEQSAPFAKENNVGYLIAKMGKLSNDIASWLLIAGDYAGERVILGDGSLNAVIKDAAKEMALFRDNLDLKSSMLRAGLRGLCERKQ